MGLKIQRLSTVVANQIAAGEVIERPASVVKELLENALDAGASVIHIEIGFGGLNQIKISDNGEGIAADDLPLAIEAHATSKIRQLIDLYSITSMGFRGEALASIASVARVTLSSRPANQAHAMMLSVEGDSVQFQACARNQGTTLDVRDLFFNAPVRKKFLKSPQQEFQAIEAVVKRFAFSAPSVAITLIHNDKQTLLLSPAVCEQTWQARIQKLLGKEFLDHAIKLNVERAGMRLHGWVSDERYQRSQNDKQWIYVNQRMVKDKLVNHALKQAYASTLHPGRHSACVLYLTLPPNEVDVNVHPTKHELRFQHPRLVHDFLTSQVTQALESTSDVIRLETITPSSPETAIETLSYPRMEIRENFYYQKSAQAHAAHFILNRQFVVVVIKSQSFLIDLEALYNDRLKQQLTQATYPLDSRPLLVPIRFSIEKTSISLMEKIQPDLAKLGIQFDFMSSTHLVIRTIPQVLPALDLPKFFAGLNDVIPTVPDLLNALVVNQSFDAQTLNQDELNVLIEDLHTSSDALIQFGRGLDVNGCRGIFV